MTTSYKIICFKEPVANEENVLEAILSAIKSYNRSHSDNQVSLKRDEIEINVARDQQGQNFGFGYIWFKNVDIANMLLGLNPDGSARVEIREKPQNLDFSFSSTANWADLCEEDECEEIILPSLMFLPSFKYTPKQKIHVSRVVEAKLKRKGVKGSEMVSQLNEVRTKEYGEFIVENVQYKEVPNGKMGNILSSLYIPQWLTEEMVREKMSKYSHTLERTFQRKIRGRNGKLMNEEYKVKYPLIQFFPLRNGSRGVNVTYNTPDEARDALLMVRKTFWINGKEKVSAIFDHPDEKFYKRM